MMRMITDERLHTLLVGPALWSVFFVVAYVVSGAGCSLGFHKTSFLGMNAIQVLTLAVALPIAGLLLLAAGHAQRRRRRLSASQTHGEDARKRGDFLYATSAVLSLLSLVGVAWLAMNAVMVPSC